MSPSMGSTRTWYRFLDDRSSVSSFSAVTKRVFFSFQPHCLHYIYEDLGLGSVQFDLIDHSELVVFQLGSQD